MDWRRTTSPDTEAYMIAYIYISESNMCMLNMIAKAETKPKKTPSIHPSNSCHSCIMNTRSLRSIHGLHRRKTNLALPVTYLNRSSATQHMHREPHFRSFFHHSHSLAYECNLLVHPNRKHNNTKTNTNEIPPFRLLAPQQRHQHQNLKDKEELDMTTKTKVQIHFYYK